MPKNIREKVYSLQNEMKKLPMRAKFVEKENLHLNFSFLGNIDEKRLSNIRKTLREISSRYSKFKVKCKKILFIPSKNYFRVLALDVKDGRDIFISISKEIFELIGGNAKPPHLTLCRVKNVFDKRKIFEFCENAKNFEVEFEINSIQLIKSELSMRGPKYTLLFFSELQE